MHTLVLACQLEDRPGEKCKSQEHSLQRTILGSAALTMMSEGSARALGGDTGDGATAISYLGGGEGGEGMSTSREMSDEFGTRSAVSFGGKSTHRSCGFCPPV